MEEGRGGYKKWKQSELSSFQSSHVSIGTSMSGAEYIFLNKLKKDVF